MQTQNEKNKQARQSRHEMNCMLNSKSIINQ